MLTTHDDISIKLNTTQHYKKKGKLMEFENPLAGSYLAELFSITGTDLDSTASMYEVGEALGLEKPEAGALAEELIMEGWVELKNLSGAVGITPEGLRALDVRDEGAAQTVEKLGDEPRLTEQGRAALETLLVEIKNELSQEVRSYANLEEIVIDCKTLEVQMLSPKPKTAIIREILQSLSSSLSAEQASALGARIEAMIRP